MQEAVNMYKEKDKEYEERRNREQRDQKRLETLKNKIKEVIKEVIEYYNQLGLPACFGRMEEVYLSHACDEESLWRYFRDYLYFRGEADDKYITSENADENLMKALEEVENRKTSYISDILRMEACYKCEEETFLRCAILSDKFKARGS